MTMAQQGKKPAATGGKYQVIAPPNMLSKRVMIKGDGAIDFAAIERAEKALAQLSGQFDNWMSEEVARLTALRDAARANGQSREALDAIFHSAHDIKGQAATLGYPLAADAAASLCVLLERVRAPERVPAVLIDQHVDAIAAIVHQAGRTSKNGTANSLLGKLRAVTLDYVAQEEARVKRNAQKADNAA